ncbi:hypothetical protein [Mongoliitalea lutea]|uniref:Uncharacterized protein n=1 Tax=Mongoliitalea lutea TaxID=849756 RepID=A0A8J3D128_9BACT|nr:hypothetical protein [Mongoliitalea lutea]GHB45494.1 hypothetical protein GCM10008106_28120 [Mongoliitalea lutea]
MRKLDEIQLEQISGGDRVTAFCAGFAASSAIYAAGAVFNWWNPIGPAGILTISAVGVACAIY